MTRFEWAYPSGVEDVKNQWISGQTMILNVVIMNMVYLVTETRVKVGEKGINDPPVKVAVTMLTYLGIFLLLSYNVVDPSKPPSNDTHVKPDADLFDLPLQGVCDTVVRWRRGAGVFVMIASGCLSFVIFATSKQTLSGVHLRQ